MDRFYLILLDRFSFWVVGSTSLSSWSGAYNLFWGIFSFRKILKTFRDQYKSLLTIFLKLDDGFVDQNNQNCQNHTLLKIGKLLREGCDISRLILIGCPNHVTKCNEPIKTNRKKNRFIDNIDINSILLNYK